MECSKCKNTNPDGYKYCGSCGHLLDEAAINGSVTQSPPINFCGCCGTSLTVVNDISLARSGLITHVNQTALDLLGYYQNEMLGKPFSIFIDNTDLVIFFSKLNELLSTGKEQYFEITLKHKNKNNIYVKLECNAAYTLPSTIDSIQIFIKETAHHRLDAAQIQAQQDLLNIIFTITNNISTVSKDYYSYSMEDALKKICLFTKSDLCFLYNINQSKFRLERVYEWRQPAISIPGVSLKEKSVSLSKVKHIMLRLRQEKTVVMHNTAALESQERDELVGWHHIDIVAFICHIIYSEKFPIGIIGVAKKTASDPWEPYCEELVKFFGDFISDRLSTTDTLQKIPGRASSFSAQVEMPIKRRPSALVDFVDVSDIDPEFKSEIATKEVVTPESASMQKGMSLEKFAGPPMTEKHPVFQRGDGLVLLTCPHCGIQESISVDQFDEMGNAIRVTCHCDKQFNVLLEKRRFFRKSVNLEGYFSLNEHLQTDEASNHTWGPMVVKDLSKTGLLFSSRKAGLVKPGDILMVRFNLDNDNQALIHKPARVISVSGQEVGCQFEGADNYDITLGFYFI